MLLLSTTLAASFGTPTPIEDPEHRGLARYFEALRAAESGRGVARALHYGDSTIAADGIAGAVRKRLTARFGDAGPGFVTAAFDTSWHARSDVSGRRSGSWSLRSILFGGAGGRYGLGGIVNISRGGTITAQAVDSAGAAVPQQRLEVWYQAGEGYGEVWAKVDDAEVLRTSAAATATEDRRFVLDAPTPFTTVAVGGRGAAVPFYGLVLETGRPGATWEALGVIGVGSKSFTTFAGEALASQVALRGPDLLVVQLGGNEAGYPILLGDKGAGYVPIFAGALQTIRAGAPDASCLVVSPLDQGYVDEETTEAKSRPGMPNMITRQREVAQAAGCAFWSAWDAMGGKGSAVKLANVGGIGTGDYVHLTRRAVDTLGELLADALLAEYDRWREG